MRIRSIPDLQNFPAYRRKFIVDTFRGQIRVRSWPRKQSAATKRKNANRIKWFKAAREMAKYAEPGQIILSKDATKGTGLYPADLQLMAAAGTLIPRIAADPIDYTTWQPRIEPVSFQGIRAPLAADQANAAGANNPLIWGLPIFQTTAFWAPGLPTRFTIPAGITKINLTAGYLLVAEAGGDYQITIRKNGTTGWAANRHASASTRVVSVTTGPVLAVATDYWEADIFTAAAATARVHTSTFFALEVLEAT